MQRISEGLAAEAEIEVLTSASRAHGVPLLQGAPCRPVASASAASSSIDCRSSRFRARCGARSTRSRNPGRGASCPGHGRLRALAVGPHLAGLVDRGDEFRPQIVLAAPAPFHTLWQAERVARRSGAALALMPCLHADPQVDHPSLLRLLRRADAVLTMTDYEAPVPDEPRRRAAIGVHRVGGGVDPPRAAAAGTDASAPRRYGLPTGGFAHRALRRPAGRGKGHRDPDRRDAAALARQARTAVLVVAGATTPRTADAAARGRSSRSRASQSRRSSATTSTKPRSGRGIASAR